MEQSTAIPATTWGHNLRRWLLVLYLVLSVADLVLTWGLIQGSGHLVYESNPVARDWLLKYGWNGLLIFKAGMVLTVALSCWLIGRTRPRLSAGILVVGCLVTGGVVIYSWHLMKELGLW